MTAKSKFGLLAALAFAFFLTGCIQSAEQDRQFRLSKMREQVTISFFVGAIVYVCAGLLGPSVTERGRLWAAEKFKLSTNDQITFAYWIYGALVVGTLVVTGISEHLRPTFMAVIVLLGGTFYSFKCHVIPGLQTGDVNRRKMAVGQIKSFFMLIVIFYIIMKFLSPEGMGQIKAA
jgi:hypothetical protein